MALDDPIDIHDEIHGICGKLGLEPGNVLRLDFYPTRVAATIALTNEDGSKYIVEADEIAQREQIFKVST